MQTFKKLLIGSSIALSLCVPVSYAGEAARHSAQSLEHSTQAIGHISVGTVKAASGIVAIPFGAVGKAGELSGQAGDGMWEFANEPLEISDEIITVGPTPADMIQQDQGI